MEQKRAVVHPGSKEGILMVFCSSSAYDQVLANAGVTVPKRDPVEAKGYTISETSADVPYPGEGFSVIIANTDQAKTHCLN